jgi:lipopolysaccharide transport system permease protein
VKKVVFPLELLPWVTAITATVHAIIGVTVWFAGYVILYGTPKPTAFLFPVVLLCLFPLLLGMGWLLSALGVAIRDIGQLATLVSHAMLFLTPIFYGVDAAPPLLQNILMANPLTFVVEQLRLVLFQGLIPHLTALAVYFALACVFAALSLWVFRRMRPRFAEMV